MTTYNCLNCEKELTDKFCSGCGQKADTHRITFKNFIFHDLLHGTFHIERGIVFTAKEALRRPGKAALDYISGKRKRYYNVFYLILLTFGLILFLRHFNNVLTVMLGDVVEPHRPYLNKASEKMDEIFSQKAKIITLLFVPISALNSFILFRRKKLNMAEHSILAGMILLGMLLISAFGNAFFYLDFIVPFSSTFASVMSWLVTVLIILHIGYGYFNAFATDYTKWGITYRLVLLFLLICLEILLLLFILIGIVTNWEFTAVQIAPFG